MEASYYAVIFTSKQLPDSEGYSEMAEAMETLAKQQAGFLGMESARSELGITVSYWQSLEAITQWKNNTQHQIAQRLGKEKWYEWYTLRICKVERAYEFQK